MKKIKDALYRAAGVKQKDSEIYYWVIYKKL